MFALQLGSWYGEGLDFFGSLIFGGEGIGPGGDFFSSFLLFSAALSSWRHLALLFLNHT